MAAPQLIPIRRLAGLSWCLERRNEPVTFGIPLPPGMANDTTSFELGSDGSWRRVQTRVLDRWPDQSARWILIDADVDSNTGAPQDSFLRICDGSESIPTDLRVEREGDVLTVATAVKTLTFRVGEPFPFGLSVAFESAEAVPVIRTIEIQEPGPIRAQLELAGEVAGTPLTVHSRIEAFRNTGIVRLSVTVRNDRRARHEGGYWPLGDPGSILLRSVNLKFRVTPVRLVFSPETGAGGREMQTPFEILQESSGGEHWNGPIHKDRDGRVTLRYKGYRIRSGPNETSGLRSSPVLQVEHQFGVLGIAVPGFWQNFPQSLSADSSGISVGVLPEAANFHELQGGEQKTWVVVVADGVDAVSNPALVWVHDPVRLYPTPEWCCGSGAIPFLVPEVEDADVDRRTLIAAAFDPVAGFDAKRERADEFGWRNFGDLPADHESAYQPADKPFVSHYNNQYDAIGSFAMQFLRSGDVRWWRLMDDLARHVRDIDIYHTCQDKAAFNGGLFWHTSHYADAGNSTHRTYPQGGAASGGPSNEHNYNSGLMWHYFMTGDTLSRDAAVSLARWVLNMEDGTRTPFKWLAAGATGLASATAFPDYHGPGRGAGNSILACLVGFQLTAEKVFQQKAEELIRRCVHPKQDLTSLNLLDSERRWSYTVFLQVLGQYLQFKRSRGEFDEMFAYTAATLLHYARWMAVNESPYLSRSEILEFPTETWAAQDLRKAEVFRWAALQATSGERDTFLERGEFFYGTSLRSLLEFPTRSFTRPLVLVIANSVRQKGLAVAARTFKADTPVLETEMPPVAFAPQKGRALRRLKLLVALGTLAAIVGVGLLLAI